MKYFNIIVALLILFNAFSFSALAQLEDPTVKPLPEFLDNIGRGNATPEEKPIHDDAQDMSAPEAEKSKIDMSDIPDEFIIEASEFGEYCRNDHTMPLYFDCRCKAVSYLDERIKRGPDASGSSIRIAIANLCKDGTGISGHVYEKCLNDFVNAPKHLDPEEFCSCYGNTYAEYFEDFAGPLTAKADVAITTKAKTVCQDPAAARRIYGVGRINRRQISSL